MKIKEINIKNFRSIKDITIPLKSYGSGVKKSNTAFLIGMNESGKSAILEAISLLNLGMDDIEYEDYCFLEAQEDNDYIDVYAQIEVDNSLSDFMKQKLEEKEELPSELIQKLKINKLEKNTYLNSGGASSLYNLILIDNIPLYLYIVNTIIITSDTKTESIELLSDFNKTEKKVTHSNAKSFLKENQKQLTKSILESKISTLLKDDFDKVITKIQIWKSSPEYLINSEINLEAFKENTSLSIPLKNIFHVYGKTDDDKIKSAIERALSNQGRRDELQEKMTDKITKHINRIWKEHDIRIRISINGNKCQVQIEDKDKKYAYYTMSQRSQGFKQFVSLILSLSAQNESDNLDNNIILIDEPEVHLHPSGVKYMRNEILKIGKKNSVFISTHSHYMIDTETPERHWLVTKEKSETNLTQISEGASIEDDSVMTSAFGLNLFKELLPKNIIVVEGNDDKNIISHCLNILNPHFFYSIKSAGGASKMPGFAKLLNEENIAAFLVFDSDKEGMDKKKIVLDNQSDFYSASNVFTLKDILNTLPRNSTIEDLLPVDFVKSFFEKEMKQSFELTDDKAIIIQLKNQHSILKENKYKLNSLKAALSKEYCNSFKSKVKVGKSERLTSFIKVLCSNIETYEKEI